MGKRVRQAMGLATAGVALFVVSMKADGVPRASRVTEDALDVVDYRYYALDSWMGAIGLPDDPLKSVVDADGTFWTERGKTSLRQGIYPLALYQSPLKIHCRLDGATERVDQRMYSPRVPISIAHKRQGSVAIEETLFLARPLDWTAEVTGPRLKGRNSLPRPRQYLLMTEYTNTGDQPAQVTPVLDLQGAAPMPNLDDDRMFEVAPNTFCRTTLPIDGFRQWEASKTMYKPELRLKRLSILPGQKARWVLAINRHGFKNSQPVEWEEADKLRNEAVRYWEKSAGLPYDVIQVPDPEFQAILDTSIRELYQMRYVINDLPAFLLGPAGYNEYWIFDGGVVTEAVDMLGRLEDASGYVDYMLLHQHEDGRIQALTMHWKETGIALVTLYRHARMLQDKRWLRERWPQLRRAVAAIGKFRRAGSSADPQALNYRLSPEGFGDAGILITAEYTNNHWLLAGMKAAVEAAQWLGETKDFEAWETEYAEFDETFQKAIARDAKTDGQGNRYIPAVMGPATEKDPTRGQWGFLSGVYPGRIFTRNDPLMLGTLKMIEAHEVKSQGGLVEDFGWSSFWTVGSSMYARDLLWLGDGRKAARLQYAIVNHASPTWNFCEETPRAPKPGELIPFEKGCGGDMPDILAAVEFIRMTGQLLSFDREQELHLFEGLPPEWLKPGMATRLNGLVTPFGPLTLELKVAADGRTAGLKIAPLSDPACRRIVVHLGDEIRELAPGEGHELTLRLSK
jgi:hypothetical protein